MVKSLRQGQSVLIAPDIKGSLNENGNPIVHDIREGNHKQLDISKVDGKIVIYERQVKEWFLGPASELSSRKETGFLVLMVVCSYIEGYIQNFLGKTSKGSSKTMFVKGFRDIFDPEKRVTKKRIEDFYEHARCGLFHDGMTRGKILIFWDDFPSTDSKPFDFSDPDLIKIYPEIAIKTIENHFDDYLNILKDSSQSEARNNFNESFIIEIVN